MIGPWQVPRDGQGAPEALPKPRWRKDRRGAVAATVALALVPVVTGVGLAIDVGRALAARSSLRAALDTAALAAAQEPSDSAATATVQRFLRANYPEARWGELRNLTVQRGAVTVGVNARASVPTAVLRVFGMDEIEVTADVEVTVGGANLEVALVLDVTGSMAQGTRILDLRAAATDLVTLVLAIELATMPAYVLMGYRRERAEGLEGALKYFLLSLLTSLVMMYGLSFLYGVTGTTNIGGFDLENEATVLDFGVEFDGGVEAAQSAHEVLPGGPGTRVVVSATPVARPPRQTHDPLPGHRVMAAARRVRVLPRLRRPVLQRLRAGGRHRARGAVPRPRRRARRILKDNFTPKDRKMP